MAHSIGKILSEHRKQIKMKQGDLSKHLEAYNCYIKPNSISSWENGVSMPNCKTAHYL
ncbi:MAG: helix-turn-helix transcriptional regulator [Lachnospiraceae bacterium]|nr:helix-turn-helix transcriptional regulator [Lachnospiraceae bacterium]